MPVSSDPFPDMRRDTLVRSRSLTRHPPHASPVESCAGHFDMTRQIGNPTCEPLASRLRHALVDTTRLVDRMMHPLYNPASRPAIADAELYLRIHKPPVPMIRHHIRLRPPCPCASESVHEALPVRKILHSPHEIARGRAMFRLFADLAQSFPSAKSAPAETVATSASSAGCRHSPAFRRPAPPHAWSSTG